MTNSDYQLIETTSALETLCKKLKKQKVLAVDTEFVRERTFYPKAGLLQVADNEHVYLIDPLTCDLTAFLQIIEHPGIKKVMHSVSEDLDVFYTIGAYEPKNIFDTQIAAAWLGSGLSYSLQKLVYKHTGIQLDKSETRTNWLARPLSPEQLVYAAEDVLHLIQIANEQQELLDSLGVSAFVSEDNQLAIAIDTDDHSLSYLHYSRAYRLDQDALNRFQRLIAWRERVARRDDKPRPHIIRDPELVEMAQLCSDSDKLNELKMHPAFRRKYLTELDALLFEQSYSNARPIVRLQDIKGSKELLKSIREELPKLAEKKGYPVEVMPSKRIIEQIIKYVAVPWYPKPKVWTGWRKELMAPLLADKLEPIQLA